MSKTNSLQPMQGIRMCQLAALLTLDLDKGCTIVCFLVFALSCEAGSDLDTDGLSWSFQIAARFARVRVL